MSKHRHASYLNLLAKENGLWNHVFPLFVNLFYMDICYFFGFYSSEMFSLSSGGCFCKTEGNVPWCVTVLEKFQKSECLFSHLLDVFFSALNGREKKNYSIILFTQKWFALQTWRNFTRSAVFVWVMITVQKFLNVIITAKNFFSWDFF